MEHQRPMRSSCGCGVYSCWRWARLKAARCWSRFAEGCFQKMPVVAWTGMCCLALRRMLITSAYGFVMLHPTIVTTTARGNQWQNQTKQHANHGQTATYHHFIFQQVWVFFC